MDPLTLTAQLNALLRAIHLPFILESPVDLTPSLLLAILESILNVRIPVAQESEDDDENHVVNGRVTPSQSRHVQTIKIFLGVLETDILQTDVGLSSLDPRLLAAGAWDEVVYVAEVLCWIGEELGLITPAPVIDKGKGKVQEPPSKNLAHNTSTLAPPSVTAPTPSPSSTITFLPPFTEISPPPTPTTTTLLFATDIDDTLQTNITSPLATSSLLRQLPNPSTHPHQPNPPTPQFNSHLRANSIPLSTAPTSTARVHNRTHSHSSTFFSASIRDIPLDDSSFTRQSPPIRRTGYISLVDHDVELSSFLERSLSISTPSPSSPSSTQSSHQRPKPRRHLRETPTHARTSPLVLTPRRPEVVEKDWRALLSSSPDHDPRRTYELLQQRMELMEELLRIRMSRRRYFQ